jgi:hypothetical protein
MQKLYRPGLIPQLKRLLSRNQRSHTALVHRLLHEDGKMIWAVEKMRLSSGQRFFAGHPQFHRFSF